MSILTFWMPEESDATAVKMVVTDVMNSLPPVEYRIVTSKDIPMPGVGEVVLAMGGDRVAAMQKAGVAQKGRSVNSLRGKPIARKVSGLVMPDEAGNLTPAPEGYGHWMVTFAPGLVMMEADKQPLIEWDVRLAHRYLTTGQLLPKIGTYGYVKDFGGVIRYIKQTYAETGKPVRLSADLETMGLIPWLEDKHIITISLTPLRGYADVVNLLAATPAEIELIKEQLEWLLTTEMVTTVGANLKYDLHWLRVKFGLICTNFKFDTLLVGSLINENRSNSLNLHAKVYTQMGGYDDCVAPETRLLTADLRWVPAGEIAPGQELVGFDEQVHLGQRRRMRLAVAESTKRLKKPGCRLTLSDGRQIVCSEDHGFLAHRYKNNGPFEWLRAYELKPGCRVQIVAPVEAQDTTFEGGWLSGLYDGEGYVSFQRDGMTSGLSQRPGPVWDRYKTLMETFGYEGFYASQANDDGVFTSKHAGWPTLSLLQRFRPERLIAKRPWDGKCVPSGAPKVTVVSVEPVGDIEVVSLQTSTHTFVAEGVASHNSFNQTHDKGRMELAIAKDPEGFVTYAGGDTDAAWQVVDEQIKELNREPSLKLFYAKVLHPAARAFENIEHRGMIVDTQAYAELRNELTIHAAEAEAKALEMIPGRLKLKHVEKGLTLSRKALISDFLFGPSGLNLKPLMLTAKSGEPRTDKAHLMMFREHPEAGPFIEAMNEWSSATKIKSTYVDGFLKHLRPDGRFHPTYMLFAGSAFEGKDDDGGTNCVAKDTLFLTSRGYVPYHDVQVGDQVLAHDGRPHKVTDTFENGVKPVRRITLAGGQSLTCTDEHPVLVEGSWVLAKDLKIGDVVTTYGGAEEWRAVNGWPFDVSNWGRVRSHARGTILKQYPKGNWGHLKVCLFRNGAQKRGPDRRDFPVHRLVAEAFVPNPDGLPEVRHKNGFGWDNTTGNLEWGSRNDNAEDAVSHGSMDRTKGSQPKLSWSAVECIRASGQSTTALAKEFGVSRRLVRAVRQGTRWVSPKADSRHAVFSSSAIVGIEELPPEMTYAVEVEGAHSHVTNGIVSHNTGRLSAVDPAVQTIPKHNKWAKKLRRCLPAPPGMVFWQADFSQGELRIAADRANEETMLHAYSQGLDLHAVTGAKLAGFELEEFLELADLPEDSEGGKIYATFRQRAKPANFGLLYGMQSEGFREYARVSTNGKMKLTSEEAAHIRDAFFALYSRLLPWHNAEINHARQHGWVMNPLGRIRHLPLIRSKSSDARSKAERQAINAPIQGCLSDMNIWAAALMEQRWGGEGPDQLWIAGATHDSIYGYCPEHNAKEVWFPRIVETMQTLPLKQTFGWSAKVSFPADIEAGPTMGDMAKVKLAL